MAIKNNSIADHICDGGIVFALCAAIFVLPVSIALLDSFVALAVFFFFVKRINRLVRQWSLTRDLKGQDKFFFVIKGLAPQDNYLNRPLLFLTLAVLASVVFSQYPKLSLYAFGGKFLKSIFMYFSFIEVANSKKRLAIFVGVFLLSGLIVSSSGAVQHYSGKDFLRGHVIGTENFISTHRINSTFMTPNGFGAYLLPIIGLVAHALFTAFTRRRWIGSVILLLLFALLLACVCWTYSRSAWVGYLAILFFMASLDYRKILYAGVLLLIFIFVFLPSLNHIRHLYLINDNAGSKISSTTGPQDLLTQGGSGRAAYWKNAISFIHSSPFVGTGLNTYSRMVMRNPDSRTWWYAHNCYLQAAAETGVIGLACLLLVFGSTLWYGISHLRTVQDPWVFSMLQGAVAGLGGFFIQSFFDNTFYTVQLSLLMWMMIALIVSLTRLKLHPKNLEEAQS
jgi:putative inorganic carbon (HCO3(-)) transporter